MQNPRGGQMRPAVMPRPMTAAAPAVQQNSVGTWGQPLQDTRAAIFNAMSDPAAAAMFHGNTQGTSTAADFQKILDSGSFGGTPLAQIMQQYGAGSAGAAGAQTRAGQMPQYNPATGGVDTVPIAPDPTAGNSNLFSASSAAPTPSPTAAIQAQAAIDASQVAGQPTAPPPTILNAKSQPGANPAALASVLKTMAIDDGSLKRFSGTDGNVTNPSPAPPPNAPVTPVSGNNPAPINPQPTTPAPSNNPPPGPPTAVGGSPYSPFLPIVPPPGTGGAGTFAPPTGSGPPRDAQGNLIGTGGHNPTPGSAGYSYGPGTVPGKLTQTPEGQYDVGWLLQNMDPTWLKQHGLG